MRCTRYEYEIDKSPSGFSATAMDYDDDDDDYVLTPLTAEAEDEAPPPPDTGHKDAGGGDDDDDAAEVMVAEDYVQSLVTIESNWATGKSFSRYTLNAQSRL